MTEFPWYEYRDDLSIDENRDRRLMTMPVLSSGELEVLKQCQHPCWDGNVASKHHRDLLYSKGLIVRFNGWQICSLAGLAMLVELKILDDRIVWTPSRRF